MAKKKNQSRNEPRIIIRCEKCKKRLRIPLRGGTLRVTCPACRHRFDYTSGEEFRTIVPRDVIGAVVALALIALGLAVPSLLYSLYGNSPPAAATFVSMMLVPAGVILLIVFGTFLLLSREDIARFWRIRRIVVSDHGIAAYRKDGSADVEIGWRQMEEIRVRQVKRAFLGLVQAGREPAAVEFALTDGKTLRIPLYLILKPKDRNRMVSALSRYVSFRPMG
jgi:phage FluMu protein Com